MTSSTFSLPQEALASGLLIRAKLDALLPPEDNNNSLYSAMRYSALSSGKALRGYLLMQVADSYGVVPAYSLQAAAAIEALHCYSLIHDDLPAMDDDAMRRGQPSCHIKFGEATAILAGDALLTWVFELLVDSATHPDPALRCQLVSVVAKAACALGMVGGQNLDIHSNGIPSISITSQIHALKTAALFAAACQCGAILGTASVSEQKLIYQYGHFLGLSFQLYDDLDDFDPESAEANIAAIADSVVIRNLAKQHIEQAVECVSQVPRHFKQLELLANALEGLFAKP